MANLTLSIDDETLRRARIRALEQGTSVNAVVREMLEAFASEGRGLEARRRVAELARQSKAGGNAGGPSWTRSALYAERTEWPPS